MSQKDRIGTVHKGNRLEYQLIYDLESSGLDPTARRTGIRGRRSQSPRLSEPADIITKLPFCIEAKNQESIKGFYKFWDQAVAQNIPPKTPLLVIKSNNQPALAVLTWDEFLFVLRAAMKGGYPN